METTIVSRWEMPEVECELANGREVRAVGTDIKGRTVYEVQPPRDNHWVETTDLDRAVRIGNDCLTAADRRWLRGR